MLLLCITLAIPPHAIAAEPVRLSGATYLGDLPTLVADKRGLFAEHGVDVTVHYGNTGRDNLRELRAGRTDFALMSLTPLVLDHLHDDSHGGPEDPVILAGMVHSRRLNHLVTGPDSGIRGANDLAGRKVGIVDGTNTEFAWSLFTDYHRLAPDFARVVHREPEALADALATGELAAALLWEPWIARIEQRTGKTLRRLEYGDLYTAHWVLAARRESVTDQPERARRVLRTYETAIDTIESEPSTVLDLYAQHAELDDPAGTDLRTTLDYDLTLDWSLIASIQQQAAWARRSGQVESARETDILSLFADAPLRAVAPAAVGIPGRAGQPAP